MFDSLSLQLKPVKQRRFWSFSLDSFFCLFCQTESFTSCWFDFFFFEVRRKWMLASDEPPTHSHSFHKVKHSGFTHLWCISDTSKRTCCKKKKKNAKNIPWIQAWDMSNQSRGLSRPCWYLLCACVGFFFFLRDIKRSTHCGLSTNNQQEVGVKVAWSYKASSEKQQPSEAHSLYSDCTHKVQCSRALIALYRNRTRTN